MHGRKTNNLAKTCAAQLILMQEIVGPAGNCRLSKRRVVFDGKDNDEPVGRLRKAIQRLKPLRVRQIEVVDDQVEGAIGDFS